MEEEDDNFILQSATSTQVVNIPQDAQSPECNICNICKLNFHTNRGLLQHLNTCRRKNNTVSNVDVSTDKHSSVVQEDLTQQDRNR